MYMYYKTALLESKRAYCISQTGLDWTGLVKCRLVKLGLVKHGLVKCGLVKHGLVKRGLVKCRLVKRGLVKRGLVKQEEKYVLTKEITISKGVHLLFVLSLVSSMQAPCTPRGRNELCSKPRPI